MISLNKRVLVFSLLFVLGACSNTKETSVSKEDFKEEDVVSATKQEEVKEMSNTYTTEEQNYYSQYINYMVGLEDSLSNLSDDVEDMVFTLGVVELKGNSEAMANLKDAGEVYMEIANKLTTIEPTEKISSYHNAMFITALSYSKAISGMAESAESGNLESYRSGIQSFRDAKSNLETAISMREESTKGMFFLKIEE